MNLKKEKAHDPLRRSASHLPFLLFPLHAQKPAAVRRASSGGGFQGEGWKEEEEAKGGKPTKNQENPLLRTKN